MITPAFLIRLWLPMLAVLFSFAPVASAATFVSFSLINVGTTTPGLGSNVRQDAPGGPYFGPAEGSLLVEFQGDGTSIENGPVSIVGGELDTYLLLALPPIITVETDLNSTFTDGDNDNIGLLTGWNGSNGTISWSIPALVFNTGTESCAGSLCGSLGTPPDGTTEIINEPFVYAEPFGLAAISFNSGLAEPYHAQFAESITAYDPVSPTSPWRFISIEAIGSSAPVPEPNTALLLSLGLVGLATKQRSAA